MWVVRRGDRPIGWRVAGELGGDASHLSKAEQLFATSKSFAASKSFATSNSTAVNSL
ncbi:MAG: hypothetical protein HC840_07105 [Leptolyngbyaceae cyanobacterium RM2_2_4]|nr:hypothetical protein [Leptolyngbyaceae cyanobacterium SM1_4_3]NJN91834.1 hypothetical protein [Leptolyngbyaceae cyanobacterium SL_5_14]NJO49246.1 hypothetical protein [Leptolyngbyaceae cyanobacterium RM2_2_4]